MNKLLKIKLIAISIILLAWLLPEIYHFVTTQKTNYPFIIYSSLHNDFLVQDRKGKEIVYKDRRNNSFTQAQTDSLVPTLYYRLLITENRMPDTLMGVHVTPQRIKKTNFFFRHVPSNINAKLVKLYPLLESLPKRIELSMPDDVCRFTDSKIQFIDMETNTINTKKSAHFQRVFNKKGVKLPLKVIGGNPTARKEYDEGYIFTDSKGQLFHFKQMAGQPYLKKIAIDSNIEIKHIFVTEFSNHASYAFITDENNRMYVLTAPDYRLRATGLPSFNPQKDNIFIMGNMFDWNVELSNSRGIYNYALNASDYTLRDSLTTPIITTKWEKASAYIFPFELKFTSRLNKFFAPRIVKFSWSVLGLNFLLALLYGIIFRKEKKRYLIISVSAIIVLGLFFFIPSWIFFKY